MTKPFRPDQIPGLAEPSPIQWSEGEYHWDIFIAGNMVGWMTKRPGYCDRGRYQINCNLPGIDHQDGFPRYYMSREVAVSETEAFLKWRLWKQRQ